MKRAADHNKSNDAAFEFTPAIIYLILYNVVQAIG